MLQYRASEGSLTCLAPVTFIQFCHSKSIAAKTSNQCMPLATGIFLHLTVELAGKYALIIIFVCMCVGMWGILVGVYILGPFQTSNFCRVEFNWN